MTKYTGLPQHWIRDTQLHIYWCPFCERMVSKWHEHHGPRRVWKAGRTKECEE